jgi:HK97 family phage major capsid protein
MSLVRTNPVAGRAFCGPGGEERAYRMGLFLRAALYDDGRAVEQCVERRIPLHLAETLTPGFLKASATSPNSAGGFLVPEELETEILNLRDLAGVYRRIARVLPIGSDKRTWPRRVSGTTAQFVNENTGVTASQATFDGLDFAAKKIAALVQLSSELYEDETAGLAAWLAEELAWSFADQEDTAAFNGTGISTNFGIRGMTFLATDGNHNAGKTTASANTYGALTATDIASFLGLVPNYAIANARLVMNHVAFANTFYRLAQSSGALASQVVNGEMTWFYLGIPITLTPKLPSATTSITGKAMMLAGDFRLGAAIAQRRGVTVRRSEDRYLDTDQIGVIGTERVDIVTHGMGDNSTVGPIVSLVAP